MHEKIVDNTGECMPSMWKKESSQNSNSHPVESEDFLLLARFERITADISGPLPITNYGNVDILVVGEYFTTFTEILVFQILRLARKHF